MCCTFAIELPFSLYPVWLRPWHQVISLQLSAPMFYRWTRLHTFPDQNYLNTSLPSAPHLTHTSTSMSTHVVNKAFPLFTALPILYIMVNPSGEWNRGGSGNKTCVPAHSHIFLRYDWPWNTALHHLELWVWKALLWTWVSSLTVNPFCTQSRTPTVLFTNHTSCSNLNHMVTSSDDLACVFTVNHHFLIIIWWLLEFYRTCKCLRPYVTCFNSHSFLPTHMQ